MATSQTKKARDIVEGDKIYTTEKTNVPSRVSASYSLGTNWAIEVDGLKQILQVDPEADVRVFPY